MRESLENQERRINWLPGVAVTIFGERYTIGAIGFRDGEGYVMATDNDGGVLLYPRDVFDSAAVSETETRTPEDY